jgi:hypothetical protein
MLPTGEVDPAMTDALTELLISALVARDPTARIVGKEEIQAQLGQSDAASVECVESAACLGRLGVQLGVSEVLAGTIARREGRSGVVWAFVLHRLDVRSGELLGRVFREVRGELAQILDALEESVPELYVRRILPGRLVIHASIVGAEVELDGVRIGRYEGPPLRRETVEPGLHVVRVRADGHVPFEREVEVPEGATVVLDAALERAASFEPSPLLYVGLGASVAALAAGIGLGVASQQAPAPSLSMRDTLTGFYPARDAEALAANVLFGVAAACAVAGVIGLVVPGRLEEPAPVAVLPTPGGVALAVRGTLP